MLDLELTRVDTTWSARFCVWGVNTRGSQEAEGEAACGTGEVPPLPLQAPDAPNLNIEVDTTTTAVSSTPPDSTRVLNLDSGDLVTGTVDRDTGQTVAFALVAFWDGQPHACAEVDGAQGWYLLHRYGTPPAIQSVEDVRPDDRPECGAGWRVGDESVLALGDPGFDPDPWPVIETASRGEAVFGAPVAVLTTGR